MTIGEYVCFVVFRGGSEQREFFHPRGLGANETQGTSHTLIVPLNSLTTLGNSTVVSGLSSANPHLPSTNATGLPGRFHFKM